MSNLRFIGSICLSVFVGLGLLLPLSVRAVVSSCTVSVSPTSIASESTTSLAFQVNNTSSETILWIQVTRPDTSFTVNGASAGGWNASNTEGAGTFSGGSSVLPSASGYFTLNVTATGGEGSPGEWSVQVSDDSGGGSATMCDGDTNVTITAAGSGGGDTTAPGISDIVVSDVTDSQVKITWTTDEAGSSVVDYGTTDEYGSTATGDSSTTSHSVTISSLSANTTYHYNVKTTDSASNTGESGDNTFATAKTGSTGTTTTGSVTTSTTTVKATPTPVPDTAGPYIVIATSVEKPFTQAPAIKATATDKSSVASLEYSVDDGYNWLPVDFIDKPNTTRTDFTFTPQLLDGNYILKIRGKDSKGNASITEGGTLIVDRLPPRIGGTVFSLGPQELVPSSGGSYILTVGLDYKVTLAAVGGPLSIEVQYTDKEGALRKTSLKKNPDNGLWVGYLRFDGSGEYSLFVSSVDGADNKIYSEFAQVVLLTSGQVHDESGPIANGQVSLYYLDDTTKQFVLWDGSAYGQVNPQALTPEGGYRLYIPAGTYYIRVTAPGYKTLVTSIFSIDQPYPIVSNFALLHARALRIGQWLIPLPDFTQTSQIVDVRIPASAMRTTTHALIDKEFPYFSFGEKGQEIVSTSLRGKPTLVTILNTWLPQASAQLAVLSEVAKKTEIHVVAILPQETVSSVTIFKKRAGYTFPVIADPDGDLVEHLGIHAFPAHVVVNRKGVVQSVQTGLYDKEQLLDMIIK